jgi:4-diphosphocytidyl-2-C-methyl-D-erythritol kinase
MRHVEAAPAKINLSLRVLRKREDGFHEIETAMAAVEGVADELNFDLELRGGEVTLSCDDPELPTGAENLVLKAVRAFEVAAGVNFTGNIQLTKRVPSGAGLGGGSSDAAATLRALDVLSRAELGAERLRELAGEIGSDVPFFIKAEPSWCRGRGEIIERFDGPLPRTAIVMAKPAFGVPSPWAYQRWATSTELDGIGYGAQAAPWGEAINDLERPVFEKFIVLATMKRWLRQRPETGVALMSGSGATVFATLLEGENGAALLEDLRADFGDSTWVSAAAIG